MKGTMLEIIIIQHWKAAKYFATKISLVTRLHTVQITRIVFSKIGYFTGMKKQKTIQLALPTLNNEVNSRDELILILHL